MTSVTRPVVFGAVLGTLLAGGSSSAPWLRRSPRTRRSSSARCSASCSSRWRGSGIRRPAARRALRRRARSGCHRRHGRVRPVSAARHPPREPVPRYRSANRSDWANLVADYSRSDFQSLRGTLILPLRETDSRLAHGRRRRRGDQRLAGRPAGRRRSPVSLKRRSRPQSQGSFAGAPASSRRRLTRRRAARPRSVPSIGAWTTSRQ